MKPAPSKMFVRAILRRCPWCGAGKLFPRWFKPVRRCPRCGLVLERGEGAMLGSMSINMGVTMVALMSVLIAWFVVDLPDVNVARAIAACAAVAIVVPVLFFPFAKTIWAAIDIFMHGFDVAYTDPDEARRLRRSS